MRIVRCPEKCVQKLRHAEARRVPRTTSYLHGFYIGCPTCGLPQAVTVLDQPIEEEGMDVGETPLVSIARIACARCGCCYRITRDEVFILKAGNAA